MLGISILFLVSNKLNSPAALSLFTDISAIGIDNFFAAFTTGLEVFSSTITNFGFKSSR